MSTKRQTTVLATVLAMLMLGLSPAFAEEPRPQCKRSDPESVCMGNITVFVFVDRVENSGSNGFFNSGLDFPLPDARVTFVMPDGSRVQAITGRAGLLNFPGVDFLPGDEALIEIEYPAQYRDTPLVPCPTSPTRRRITHDSFGSMRSTQIVFCAQQYRPILSPGAHD